MDSALALSVAYPELAHRCQKSDINTEEIDNTLGIFRNYTSNAVQNIVCLFRNKKGDKIIILMLHNA